MKNILIAFVLSFSLISVFAQKKDAGQLYEQRGYKASASLLETQKKLSTEDLIKVATSYRLNHDVVSAEQWYAKVIQQSNDPIHLLYYAQASHSNKKYEQAKEYYQLYNQRSGGSDQRGHRLSQAIDAIQDFAQDEDTKLMNERIINSPKIDFSPAFYQDGIVFVSSRSGKKANNRKNDSNVDKWTNDNYMDLFFAAKDNANNLKTPSLFSTNLKSSYHEGPVCFSKNGTQIFFSRSQQEKGKKVLNEDRIMRLNIYTATKKGEDWEEVTDLSFNTMEYDEVHPTLSADGQKLYFASNRSGGFGGMDIYVATRSGNQWVNPVNLGASINTAGNEIFPFVHEDGTLYFASDGWGSLGGLDIFSSIPINENTWEEPVNIGLPFNSSKDDFGFILNTTGTEGYLSSAREGGIGQDDIYHFRTTDKDQIGRKVKAKICVFDEDTNAPIEGVLISLSQEEISKEKELENFTMKFISTGKNNEYLLKMLKDNELPNNKSLLEQLTNQKGEAWMQVIPNESYFLVAQKNDYELVEESIITTLNEQNEIEYCFAMKKSECVKLKGKVINQQYERVVPNAEITLTNLCNGEVVTIYSDSKGNYLFPCIPCDCDFEIEAIKTSFKTFKKAISTMNIDCATQEKMIANLLMINGEDAPSDNMPTANNANPYRKPNYDNTESLTDIGALEVGKIIELKNIYYDFDKYHIRQGAQQTLDELAELLHSYPSMTIELSSHTDSRGTQNYNNWLSRLRAQSAVDYLIDKGVSSNRLLSKGYGEMQLKNHCDENTSCNEGEHQMNRRTEIKILEFDRQDIGMAK